MTDLITRRPGRARTAEDSAPHRSEQRTNVGSSSRDDGEQTNRLEPFDPAILAVRWATTGVSVALASPDLLDADLTTASWVGLVLANTILRTFAPFRYTGSLRSTLTLLAEIGLHVLAVTATGYWDSAVVLLLINAVIISGFARGIGFAALIAGASTIAVSIPAARVEAWRSDDVALAAQWATLLFLAGVASGYTRRISGEATRRHSLALDRVAALSDANALLTKLHQVAQTLPASLDRGDVLDSSLSRLRGLVRHDSALILTREDTDDSWNVAHQTGFGLAGSIDSSRLPSYASQAVFHGRLVSSRFDGRGDAGFGPQSASGMSIPLLARGNLIGLLAVESRAEDAFSDRDARVVTGFVEPVALAIDNARWFGRIRTVGADEERNRIARDIHDRIGQSLAYLGFEIDRLIRLEANGADVSGNLQSLRNSLRAVITEVRDTLSDLRTGVTDTKDFATIAEQFANRIAERSKLTIHLDCDTEHRLPILQEREMWRIAQEALVNVERHASATEVTLTWRCRGTDALLKVVDNGQGLPAPSSNGRFGRSDSYGIMGMRERADSIGATLELSSKPGEGTRLRCFLAKR